VGKKYLLNTILCCFCMFLTACSSKTIEMSSTENVAEHTEAITNSVSEEIIETNNVLDNTASVDISNVEILDDVDEWQEESTQKNNQDDLIKKYDYEQAYISIIDHFRDNYVENGSSMDPAMITYNLVWINDDDVPELVVNTRYLHIYTYDKGVVYTLANGWVSGAAGNHGYWYLPRKNLIYNHNSDYAGALAHESYFSIDDNYELKLDDTLRHLQHYPPNEEPTGDNIDFQGPVYYFINDEEVSKEEYYSGRDMKNLTSLHSGYTYEEIMEYLTTETVPKYSTFEVIMDNCTWEEARDKCIQNGGHLATVKFYSEHSLITRAIAYSESNGLIFYLGGSKDGNQFIWSEDGTNSVVEIGSWYDGEPSGTGKSEDGRVLDESVMVLYVDKSAGYNQYYYMDVPNDILDAAPSYFGLVGYVMEVEH